MIPVNGDPSDELALARRIKGQIGSEDASPRRPRQYSARLPPGAVGGWTWTPASKLPPEIVQLALAAGAGSGVRPVTLPNAVALFLLRGITEVNNRTARPRGRICEYPLAQHGHRRGEVEALRNRVDTCKDLWAEARNQHAERFLKVETRAVSEVPQDVGLHLAQMDPGEVNASLVRGTARVVLMLCSRQPPKRGAA